MFWRRFFLGAAALGLPACVSDTVVPDAGVPDSGAMDTGVTDSGAITDSGAMDTGIDSADASDGGCVPNGTIGIEKSASTNNSSPVTIAAFNPGTCPNRLLLVGLSFSPNGLAAGLIVSFNGKAMTEVPNTAATANGNNNPGGYFSCVSKVFAMVNPTGIGNIVATFSGVSNNPIWAAVGAVALYNVYPMTPTLNGVTASASSASISIKITSAAGHMVFANNCNYSTATPALGDIRWNELGPNAKGAASTLASTGSSATISWLQSPAYAWSASGVDIVPSP